MKTTISDPIAADPDPPAEALRDDADPLVTFLKTSADQVEDPLVRGWLQRLAGPGLTATSLPAEVDVDAN